MKTKLGRILKSKWIVILAIAVIWMAGSQVTKVYADYKAGTAYQNFLLGTKAEDVKEGAESQKAPLKLGSLGSGGVSGQLSYDEIVNSAPENKVDEAKQFTSTMATYSTFGYFSNKSEGFSSIVGYTSRVAFSVILLPLALLMDVIHLIIPTLITLLAKLNVVRLLAAMVTNLNVTSDLLAVTGVSKETFQAVVGALLSFAVAMILLSFVGMFRSTGKVDQRSYGKLKGRLITLIALPLIVGIGASLLDEVANLTSKDDGLVGNYSRYLVDDRSWAYNFNFAPNGDNGEDGNISPTTGSSYVDLKYNPYTMTGAERIKRINSQSSLANNDEGNIFPNTALALAYGTSQSFSAIDYINYKGTKASEHFYGRSNGDGKGFGSYYQYAQDMKNVLIDVENSYFPSSAKAKNEKNPGAKTDQKGGYSAAIDDYSDGKALTVSPQVAWRDRFIYGVKNSGANMDKYYGETPSVEQMNNEVGTNGSGQQAFSDQSMYLILSTMFDETGGKYFIDAPARGINAAKAYFDSNRSNYFVVSMVGNPFFTIFGLIATPILQLVVFLSVAAAVVSVGIVEMNTKPLVAWFKGMTLGDIEYPIAFLIYCVGIAGTILALFVIPPLLVNVFLYIPKLLLITFTAGKVAFSPQASLALHGTPLIVSAMFSLFVAFLYYKSPSFRYRLAEVFTFAWIWAKTTGERLEIQANGGAGIRVKQEQQQSRQQLNKMLNDSTEKTRSKFGEWFDGAKGEVQDDLNKDKKGDRKNKSPKTPSNTNTRNSGDYDNDKLLDADTVAQNGMYERAGNALQEAEMDPTLSPRAKTLTIDAQESILALKNTPNPETLKNALSQLDLLDAELNDGDLGKDTRIDIARNELYNLSHAYELQGDDGKPMSPPPLGKVPSDIFEDEQQDITKRVYERKHVQKVADDLGELAKDEGIADSLHHLDVAQTAGDWSDGVTRLQSSVINYVDKNKGDDGRVRTENGDLVNVSIDYNDLSQSVRVAIDSDE
ncbi:hypothetical protein [Listeria booriae]|uniref:Uncharacterized protein n=1 Tax=Listeria booriae TaxID=1552123 RepID=A0A842FGV2_9LIST|nr:hypothetical protein [Listeria booriae]MBC2242236.1 hypothetical protein [Listeria booriae]